MFKLLLVLLAALCLTCNAQFLAGSEGNFKHEAKAPSGSVFDAAMTAEMNAASGNIFQLEAINLEKIRDAQLRRHLAKYLKKPLQFKLTNNQAARRTGNTYRAVVKAASGDKLRGFWKRGADTETLKGKEILELTYDEALRRRGSVGTCVEFEVQLPPHKGFMPSVVYSVVLGTGSSNRESTSSKTTSLVKIHPKGLAAKGFKLGRSFVGFPMKSGIVDPSWSRGRTIFRTGRSVGQV